MRKNVGLFKITFQYILALGSWNWSLKVPYLSHLGPIWPNLDSNLDIPGPIQCLAGLSRSNLASLHTTWVEWRHSKVVVTSFIIVLLIASKKTFIFLCVLLLFFIVYRYFKNYTGNHRLFNFFWKYNLLLNI